MNATLRISVPSNERGIRTTYADDKLAMQLRKDQQGLLELLKYRGKVYVPESYLAEIIADHHDEPLHGHPGISKTTLVLQYSTAPRARSSLTRVDQRKLRLSANSREGPQICIRLPLLPTKQSQSTCEIWTNTVRRSTPAAVGRNHDGLYCQVFKVGPFSIKEVRGPVNYELDLPSDAKVHPVFHVSLLEPADPETPLQPNF